MSVRPNAYSNPEPVTSRAFERVRQPGCPLPAVRSNVCGYPGARYQHLRVCVRMCAATRTSVPAVANARSNARGNPDASYNGCAFAIGPTGRPLAAIAQALVRQEQQMQPCHLVYAFSSGIA